jgi:hypothetical protein
MRETGGQNWLTASSGKAADWMEQVSDEQYKT